MIELLKAPRLDLLLALAAVLASAPVIAAIDLRDYDNDLMRDLDKTVKYFEPDITAQNSDAAREDAQVLLDGFKYTESYFTKKGAADAVEISRKGVKVVNDVLANVDANNFDAAAAAARETPNLCKSCHDIYKPRLAR
ncbi:hypothetical protein [Methylocystis parvus]|uniref:Cytochrome c n=1 Tax=Methylocystis parvus TaxID=134 RepID=A0A6B8M612_9HYPH|nr:hypothetical protein [Methylocystis parvus]QGM97785.1 hypothetical protein F7D14_10090 [Methylocystis parvus]WBK01910.1 hypothetical protein MMG94_09495 [Methylocystis parvus OBBP]